MTHLARGDDAPEFRLLDQNGNGWGLSDFAGQFLALFFYKQDGTPYCTEQVEGFRDLHAEFKRLGAKIIGVSRDDVQSHHRFASECGLPFNLLADPDLEVAKRYGIAGEEPDDPVSPLSRDTFLIGPDGAVLQVFKNVKDTKEHAEKVLESLKKYVKVPAG